VRSSDRQAVSGSQALRVSFICTANRARSPFAAAILRRERTALPIEVESFGTLDHEGAPALPQAIRTARAFDVDLMTHRARSALPGTLGDSDLVVGFEPFHVAHAVVTGGAERSRTFLLSELVSALAVLELDAPRDAAEFGAVLAQADATRAGGDWRSSSIADPVGGSDRRFAETYARIEDMVVVLAVTLFGA
jgi:protein-tyrosine-phosphatase